MGRCKKCKEIFPPQELRAGYCEACYTPELEAEDKRIAEEKSNAKPSFVSRFLSDFISNFVIGILIVLVVAFFKYKDSDDTKRILQYCYQKNDDSKMCTVYKTLFGWSYKGKR